MRISIGVAVATLAVVVFGSQYSVAQGPFLEISESVLDFGCVEVGGSEVDVVTVTNISNENLAVVGTIVGSNGFSTPAGGAGIAPGFSVDIAVTCEPTADGDIADVLKIEAYGNSSMQEFEVDLVATAGTACAPSDMVAMILADFDECIANGTIYGAGTGPNSNRRWRALRNRIRAVDFLLSRGYDDLASFITSTAILRSDGQPSPRDLVEGPCVADINAQLEFLKYLIDN